MIINGREYPMWSQFVEGKARWIGGKLQDQGDSYDISLTNGRWAETEITDITLEPNGKTSAMFSVDGKDFCCAGDVGYLGITAGDKGWITLSGYGGHTWRIKPAKDE